MADRTPPTRTAARTRAARLSRALALLAVLVGCATTPSEIPMSPTPEPTLPRPSLTPLPPEPTPKPMPGTPSSLPLGHVPDAIAARAEVKAAVAAEAERKGVSASDVKLAGYADVTWPDGAIGCPQPGMMYTQALVPGHQLILRVGGELASYHAAKGHAFTFCANPRAAYPGSPEA